MALLTDLAFSEEMPALIFAVWRTVPPAASSTLRYSSDLSDTFRFTSFSSRSCRSAVRRSSLLECISISSSLSSMLELVPLKSKRVESSRDAWSTALRTSWASTSETTSKLGMRSFLQQP